MPTRLLREGILSSDAVNQLDWSEEVFYRRLMSKVDDHGLFDARLSILRSSLYPLKVDRVREADISRWMAACQKAGLIVLYEADGKPYLQMLNTNWQKRGEPKYPIPKDIAVVNNGKQAETKESISTVVVVGVEDVVVDKAKGAPDGASSSKSRKKTLTAIPAGFGVSDRVRAWAASRGHSQLDAHLENFITQCQAKGYTYSDWDAAFMGAITKNWAKLTNAAPKEKPSSDCQSCGKPGIVFWNRVGTKGNCRECGPV